MINVITVEFANEFNKDWSDVTGRLKKSGYDLSKILISCTEDRPAPIRRRWTKSVVHLESGTVYQSVKEAASAVGLAPSTISCAIRGGRSTTKGHFDYLPGR